ncbi:MAG: hypothetical protein JKY32_04140 [Rhizobiales bacterium]|nr:hypothetical protein [Hyphomicrobiales bacterium]
MSVTTYSQDNYAGLGSRIGSALKRAFAAMIRAREAQAHRYIAQHLSVFDDRTIEGAGFTRDQLMKRPRDLASF